MNSVTSTAWEVADLLTAGGVSLTALGVLLALRQLNMSRKIARGEFMLHLYELIQEYNDVHEKLRYGAWAKGEGRPGTEHDWARVDRYMGLFENIFALAEDHILSLKAIDRAYAHRIAPLVAHPAIFQRNLVERQDGWKDFLALIHALETKGKYYPTLYKNRKSEQKMQGQPKEDTPNPRLPADA